jgi:hypothetical protein
LIALWNAAVGKQSIAGSPAASDSSRASDECLIVSRSVESLERSAAEAIFPRQANGAPDGSGVAQTNVPRPTYPRSRPRDSSSR